MPSKVSPGPSPYIGWKWSKPQAPSKPELLGELHAADDLVPRHPLLGDIESESHPGNLPTSDVLGAVLS